MKRSISLFVLAALVATPALALDLASARSAGNVCEKPDGYLTATGGGAEVQDLVSSVNEGRKAEYARIAKENKQTVQVAASLAAGALAQKGYKTCK